MLQHLPIFLLGCVFLHFQFILRLIIVLPITFWEEYV
ncbi:putative membrane protein, partial [Bacteroides fragilis str. 3986 N(B)19]